MSKHQIGTKGLEFIWYSEAHRDAVSKVHHTFRINRWAAHYVAMFGEFERMHGKISVNQVMEVIVTGKGQMYRLLRGLVSIGMLRRVDGMKAGERTLGYWLLTDTGREAHRLFVASYFERLERLRAHSRQQKRHNK